jgi:hypothetical protein
MAEGASGAELPPAPEPDDPVRDAEQALRRAASQGAVFRNVTIISIVVIGLAAAYALIAPKQADPWLTMARYAIVGGLAGLVGFGELVSRYQDRPGRLLGEYATIVYVLVNAVSGLAALDIVIVTHIFEKSDPAWLYQMLLAGFGAVAFFRTSLFTVRIGGTDVGIGPSALLQSLLNAADRMLDRGQAGGRAGDAAEIMRKVDFAKARTALPVLCMIAVQGIPDDVQENVSKQIEAVNARNDITPEAKSIILGIYLIRIVGPDVLERSVEALGTSIQRIREA